MKSLLLATFIYILLKLFFDPKMYEGSIVAIWVVLLFIIASRKILRNLCI